MKVSPISGLIAAVLVIPLTFYAGFRYSEVRSQRHYHDVNPDLREDDSISKSSAQASGGLAPAVVPQTDTQSASSGPADLLPRSPVPRIAMTHRKRAMLAEFFAQVGIDKTDAEQIVEKLVDIDIRQAELSSQMLAKKHAVAADDEFVSLSVDEAHSLSSIAADEVRSVLGLDYEAYVVYTETFIHRQFIDQVSASLPAPLNSSAREELVSIFHEETLKSVPQIEFSSAEVADKDVQIKALQTQIDSLDERNKAILERAHAYLTNQELDEIKLHMRKEIQRVEAMKLFIEST